MFESQFSCLVESCCGLPVFGSGIVVFFVANLLFFALAVPTPYHVAYLLLINCKAAQKHQIHYEKLCICSKTANPHDDSELNTETRALDKNTFVNNVVLPTGLS